MQQPSARVSAGSVDSGSVVAGSVDSGSADSGSVDSGSVVAGSVDSGSVVSGSVVAGSVVSAGSDVAGSVSANPAVPTSLPAGGALTAATALPRIALVGVHGYGERHLANLARLEASGALELVAVADPNPPADGVLGDSVAVFGTLDELLAAGPAPDVVILATPIQTHAPLALAALAAGADIYVEKPPVASLQSYRELLATAQAGERLVQVGFQSLGSAALPAIRSLIADGRIGDVLGFSAKGAWMRTRGYFKRSRWAGKRSLDGTDVVDGVATNALAHAVATGLSIAGAHTVQDVASVETDLYHAHPTESDDTSVIRVRTTAGKVLMCALTLCAAEQSRPSVTVYGTLGTAEFFYTEDELVVTDAAGERREVFGRSDLLENLLEARAAGTPLLSPLAGTGAFTAVLEAIRTAPAPRQIAAGHITWEGDGDDAHPVVHGIAELINRAALAQATFSELGAPWARPQEPAGSFSIAGRHVASYVDGSHIRATSSPRPYLHPVRTLSGIVVTDHQPADHVWHLGVGVALQDVDGVNFWGGRTYTRDAGAYVWRPDHGSITRDSARETPGSLDEALSWNGPDGTALLREQRCWTWAAVDPQTWRLTLDFTLSPAGDRPVSLGSPGSNGRHQGGYGGFFWRLPACPDAEVWSATGSGEAELHGAVTPWLAWTGTFDGGPATLVFVAAEGCADPWFVRVGSYPGVGQSLAWDSPVIVSPEAAARRRVTVLVADGRLETADIQTLINNLGDHS
jgi:predicted dehydrogenase